MIKVVRWCTIRTGWDQASSKLASSIEIWTVQYAGRDTFHVTELFVTWPRSALKVMKRIENVRVAVVSIQYSWVARARI